MNHSCIAMISITPMMVISMMTAIHANCHNRKCHKIGWIITVIVRRIIWHICRRIDILYNWRRFYHNGCGCRRNTHSYWLRTNVGRVGSNRGSSSGFRFNDVILTIQIYIAYNLHRDFFILIF